MTQPKEDPLSPSTAPVGVPTARSAETLAASPQEITQRWLDEFHRALTSQSPASTAEVFEPDGFWRDFVSFTWNLHTAEGRDEIASLAAETVSNTEPQNWAIREEPTTEDGVTTAWLSFETNVGRGQAFVRIRDGLAWTLLTTLSELHGFEESVGSDRPQGVAHSITRGRSTWLERRQAQDEALGVTEQPYTLIVGGGQGGIGLAARLKNLDVPTLVVDRYDAPGDAWRNRYRSLHLHDPVWYDHLPYMKFPDNWPVFPSKDKIADWLKYYTDLMELNYWAKTTCTNARWDEEGQHWVVTVDRDGEEITLHPTHLIFALGVSGYPRTPQFEGQDLFQGEQHHSSAHPGGEEYAGKKAVVIGSNNSAHDICASLWEHGADVTMVQRSSTHISPSHSLRKLVLGPLYSEEAVKNGIDTAKADLLFASWPYKILPDVQRPAFAQMREDNVDFYQALESIGFSLDFGEDGSGLFLKYLRRGSGYYIDVGASQLLIDKEIHLVSGQVDHLVEHAVVLSDGTEVPADLVVYATGFGSMNQWLEDLISPEVAEQVGKCWGYGSGTTRDPGPWEGELRNMWKPTNVKNLWVHGGNLHQSRHYSKYLALQVKARYEGIPTPIYRLQASHHPS